MQNYFTCMPEYLNAHKITFVNLNSKFNENLLFFQSSFSPIGTGQEWNLHSLLAFFFDKAKCHNFDNFPSNTIILLCVTDTWIYPHNFLGFLSEVVF